ncbi:MAG: ThuA domain-containing protein [Bryobacteraceae bacterium]
MAKPVKTLLLTGDNHPAHKWKETTPALIEAMHNRGPEFAVTVTEDIETLAQDLSQYRLLVLNYCNWTRPGLSPQAKTNLTKFVREGGGLAVIHFANGAFHFSLPNAPESDWPEYRNLVARVWDHSMGKSGHDTYGSFRVTMPAGKHPITEGMQPYEAIDELYYRQQGEREAQVLATAKSNVTHSDEPMALLSSNGRVFQTCCILRTIGVHGTMQRFAGPACRKRPINLVTIH